MKKSSSDATGKTPPPGLSERIANASVHFANKEPISAWLALQPDPMSLGYMPDGTEITAFPDVSGGIETTFPRLAKVLAGNNLLNLDRKGLGHLLRTLGPDIRDTTTQAL